MHSSCSFVGCLLVALSLMHLPQTTAAQQIPPYTYPRSEKVQPVCDVPYDRPSHTLRITGSVGINFVENTVRGARFVLYAPLGGSFWRIYVENTQGEMCLLAWGRGGEIWSAQQRQSFSEEYNIGFTFEMLNVSQDRNCRTLQSLRNIAAGYYNMPPQYILNSHDGARYVVGRNSKADGSAQWFVARMDTNPYGEEPGGCVLLTGGAWQPDG